MKAQDVLMLAVIEALSNKGILCDSGCRVETAQMYVLRAYQLVPHKPVCSVSGWKWIDIEFEPDSDGKSLEPILLRDLQCSFLISDYVIQDDSERFSEGSWVRTSFLKKFHENCIFETENTSYLLVGSGRRISISVDEAIDFFGR